jgi:hypothetical protein
MTSLHSYAPAAIRTEVSAPEQSRYAVAFRRSSGEEQRLIGGSEEELRARYAELWPAGWRLRHLRGHAADAGARYTAIWRKSLRSEVSVFGVSLAELTERYERLWEQGWRLRDAQAHPVATEGKVPPILTAGYSAVWEPSREPERQVYFVSLDDFAGRYRELAGQGWRLKSLSVMADPWSEEPRFTASGEPRYTALWHPSVAPEIVAHEMSQVVYQARYERLWVQGWRLKFVAPYVVDGRSRYSAVWNRSPTAEIQMPAATESELEARYQMLWQQGWRLKFMEPYGTAA